MRTEREAFIRAIMENPGDGAVLLIFADWLGENGEGNDTEIVPCLSKAVKNFDAFALSAACVTYGRTLAGLSPPPQS